MATRYGNGFNLEVTIDNELPHVRISLRDGAVVVDTDKVSIQGLRSLAAVFERAASMAFDELERYAQTEQCKYEANRASPGTERPLSS
jgi:hypothetical protein